MMRGRLELEATPSCHQGADQSLFLTMHHGSNTSNTSQVIYSSQWSLTITTVLALNYSHWLGWTCSEAEWKMQQRSCNSMNALKHPEMQYKLQLQRFPSLPGERAEGGWGLGYLELLPSLNFFKGFPDLSQPIGIW